MFARVLSVVLLLVLLVLQLRLWVGEGSLAERARLNKQIEQQSAENERVEAKNQLINAEIKALKEGKDAVEARARNQMGMIKEGETFYMIVDEALSSP